MPTPVRKSLPTVSPYQQLVAEWKDCTACELHATRQRVCFARGKLPADVLFIGEAPGLSEDAIGQPFVGPAGELLDHVIAKSLGDLTWCLTNLVMCAPYGENNRKLAEPDMEHVDACKPRLEYFARIVEPKLIVTVGKCAMEYCNPMYRDHVKLPLVPIITITHPAAIIRSPIVGQSLAIQRCITTLRSAVSDLREGGGVEGDMRANPF